MTNPFKTHLSTQGSQGPQGPQGPQGSWNDDPDHEEDINVKQATRSKTKIPSHYCVLMLNDDFTPMDFVVLVLEQFFGKTLEEATEIMLQIHHKGVGRCGVFTREIAETKAAQVMELAQTNQHPLRCTIEKE